MSTDRHLTKASLRELEPLFVEGVGRDNTPLRHAMRRLQPTILPPPPEDDGAPAAFGASHEDDLDLGLDADDRARRRQWLLAAFGVAAAIVGTVGYLAFGPAPSPEPEAIVQPRPVAPTLPAPAPSPFASPPADASMAVVSDELIAPATDGLSPPRKVNAVRIVVEGDREIRPR